MHWFHYQWFTYWWPSDKGNGPENIQWTAIAVVVASVLIPPVRKWIEKHIVNKVKEHVSAENQALHEKLDLAHEKMDHIIFHSDQIPEFKPKEKDDRPSD